MNERTFGTRHLIRTVVMAAFIAMLALTTAQRASANQSGPTVNEAAQFQMALCRAAGGTATIETHRTVGGGLAWTEVTCAGGSLDGMWCFNGKVSGTFCTFDRTVQSESEHIEPTGGVEETQTQPIDTPATTDETAEPASAEEPVVEQPETVDESVDPGQAEEPVADDGTGTDDGQVIDQPETVDEVFEPVVAEEPVIEQVPTVEESVDPGIVIDGTYEVTFEVQEPAVVE